MLTWKIVRFLRVEGESGEGTEIKDFNIDMNVSSMKRDKGDLRADFTYRIDYSKKVGHLILKGYVLANGPKKEVDGILNAWKKRTLPEDFAAQLSNVIFYNCEVNGVMVSRVLAIPAPVIPPNLTPERVVKE